MSSFQKFDDEETSKRADTSERDVETSNVGETVMADENARAADRSNATTVLPTDQSRTVMFKIPVFATSRELAHVFTDKDSDATARFQPNRDTILDALERIRAIAHRGQARGSKIAQSVFFFFCTFWCALGALIVFTGGFDQVPKQSKGAMTDGVIASALILGAAVVLAWVVLRLRHERNTARARHAAVDAENVATFRPLDYEVQILTERMGSHAEVFVITKLPEAQ
jgi:hypothetical protein